MNTQFLPLLENISVFLFCNKFMVHQIAKIHPKIQNVESQGQGAVTSRGTETQS